MKYILRNVPEAKLSEFTQAQEKLRKLVDRRDYYLAMYQQGQKEIRRTARKYFRHFARRRKPGNGNADHRRQKGKADRCFESDTPGRRGKREIC